VVPARLYDNIYENGEQLDGYRRYFVYAKLVSKARNPLRQLARSEDVYWGVEKVLNGLDRSDSNLRVLEVGSGLGYLVAALRASGYDATGLDVSASAVAEAKKRYGDWFEIQDVSKLIVGERSGADAVIALELIEHVEKPLSMIEDLLGALNAGGELIVSTPNRSYYPEETLWATDLPPVHLHWISEAGMRGLAQRIGCTVQFLDFTDFNKSSRLFRRPRLAMPSEPQHRLDENFRPIRPYKPKYGYRERFFATSAGALTKAAQRRFRPLTNPLPCSDSRARSESMVVRISRGCGPTLNC
jgi:SAM-dependent methyltransferase